MLKRLISFYLICAIFISSLSVHAQEKVDSENLSISAKSSILICADSGMVIYSKNEHQKLAMASTTKIMTALLAFEKSESNDKEVQITEKMVKIEGSSMGLLPGNVVTLKNMARGMMMCSGNDAANSIAITIADSNEDFCKIMNDKARQIGMNETNFATASGLDRDDHYSTSNDMAILGAYAMENKAFYDTVCCKTVRVPFIKPAETHVYKNHNKLLWQYEDCIGIKTGFTEKAGRCLVSCAQKDGVRLVAVTLHAHSDWNDHKKLYEYGFSKVSAVDVNGLNEGIRIKVVGSNEEFVNASIKMSKSVSVKNEDIEKIVKTIEAPEFLNAPIEKGQVVGKIVYYLDDNVLATNELISDRCAKYQCNKKGFLSNITNFFSNIFS